MNTPTIEAKPETGDLKELRRLFGIPKSTAYELAEAGDINFIRLRKRGRPYGKVLVDFVSVREYLAKCKQVEIAEAEATAESESGKTV